MKVITGTVVDGKIVVEGEQLLNGSKVTVIAQDGEDTFELTLAQEAELLEAISELERGEGINGNDFLAGLDKED